MVERIAFFASRDEVEAFFGPTADFSKTLFTPHYNLAPAHHVLTVFRDSGNLSFRRARWGLEEFGEKEDGHLVSPDEIEERLGGDLRRGVIPISGFYLWKESGKRSAYPFFIRLLNESVMAVAAVVRVNGSDRVSEATPAAAGSCAMITTPSSILVQPLTDRMPLILDRELVDDWLDGNSKAEEIEREAEGRFLMNDMSVLRVSKKVGDLNENSPELIQPLPK